MKRLAAVAVALPVLLTACQSSPDSADRTEPQDGNGQGDLATVVFQPATESMAVLVQLNAFAGDYFGEEGLEITYNAPIPNAAQAAQSVTTNSDIAIVGSSGVMAATATGRPIVSVATLTKGPSTQFVMRKEVAERIGITDDMSVEEKVQTFKGLALGLPAAGSSTDVIARETLRKFGVDPDGDMTIRPVAEPAALVTALREGQVDIIAFSPPTSSQPVAEGIAVPLFSVSDLPEYANMPWVDVITSKDYLESNRAEVLAFVRALVKAANDLEADAEGSQERIRLEYFPDMAEEVFELGYDVSLPTATRGLEPDEEGFDLLQRVLNDGSDQQTDLSFADMYDTTIVDEASN